MGFMPLFLNLCHNALRFFDMENPNPTHVPLAIHVKKTVKDYLIQLDGHDIDDLHQLVISEVEKPLLETVLEHYNYNQTRVAQILGLSRSTLRKKIELYQIK
jgi:Fis family transcriptional regulator